MNKKRRMIIGVVSALVLCLSFGGGYLLSRNGGIDELLEETGLSKKSRKDEEDKKSDADKDDGFDAGAAGALGNAENGGVNGAGADGIQKTDYVDNGGANVGGTSQSESFSIKMSDLCTFSDPSGISFDTRYVLYGGPDCIPAKRAAAAKAGTCKGAYVILYASGGKAVGEYVCYVMSSEAEARSLASAFSNYDTVGNWGDVTYVYSSGSYVQTSIDTYYKAGTIKSATPQAYLGMQFYFGGMSEYKPSSNPNGGGNTNTPSTPNNPVNPTPNPTPTPDPSPNPTPTPDPTPNPNPTPNPDPTPEPDPEPDPPGTSNEETIVVKADQLTDKIDEASTPKDEVFEVKVTDKFTITDPEDIEYDTRYVLYGSEDCIGVTSVPKKDNGVETKVESLYVVLYVKNNEPAAEYRYYLSKSEEGAQAVKRAYGNTDTVKGRICFKATTSSDEIKSLIHMLYQYSDGALEDETPKAYLNYLVKQEKYQFFKNAGHKEEPKPEPGSSLKGTVMANTFGVRMSENCTYTDAGYFTQDYDKRYVLYGDKECAYAKQSGAEGFYVVLYDKASKPAGEYKAYVMSSQEQAEQMRQQMGAAFGEDAVLCKGNVVFIFSTGEYVQQTIETYVQYGIMTKGTIGEYLESQFVNAAKMTEIIEEPGSNLEPEKETAFDIKMTDGYTFRDAEHFTQDYDVRYVLYDAGGASSNAVGAEELYEIIYEKDGKAIGDYQCCIMENAGKAEELVDKAPILGIDPNDVKLEGNIVLVFAPAEKIQTTIDMYVQYGMLHEASAKAYADFLAGNGMKLITSPEEVHVSVVPKEGVQTASAVEKMRQIAREAGIEPAAEGCGNADSLTTAAKEAGIESEGNLLGDEADDREEIFDPAEAGNVRTPGTVQEEMAGPSDIQTSDDEPEKPSAETPKAEGEAFDPADAGSVQTPEAIPETPEAESEAFNPADAGSVQTPEAVPEAPADGNFDPSKAGTVEEPSVPAEDPKNIQITPDYTFTDPQGLVYDARYVFHKDGDSELASMLTAERNTAISGVYLIFYVKDQKVLTEYRCFVMNGSAVCEETAQEKLSNLIGSLPGMDKAYEASPKGYQEYIKEVYRLEELKEGER
jgi:hypothetical protein